MRNMKPGHPLDRLDDRVLPELCKAVVEERQLKFDFPLRNLTSEQYETIELKFNLTRKGAELFFDFWSIFYDHYVFLSGMKEGRFDTNYFSWNNQLKKSMALKDLIYLSESHTDGRILDIMINQDYHGLEELLAAKEEPVRYLH